MGIWSQCLGLSGLEWPESPESPGPALQPGPVHRRQKTERWAPASAFSVAPPGLCAVGANLPLGGGLLTAELPGVEAGTSAPTGFCCVAWGALGCRCFFPTCVSQHGRVLFWRPVRSRPVASGCFSRRCSDCSVLSYCSARPWLQMMGLCKARPSNGRNPLLHIFCVRKVS